MLALLDDSIYRDRTCHIMKRTSRCYFVGMLCSLPPSILHAASSQNIIGGVQESCVTVMCDDNLLLLGPPVNVTCNIFINSFGSITETTMVRISFINLSAVVTLNLLL